MVDGALIDVDAMTLPSRPVSRKNTTASSKRHTFFQGARSRAASVVSSVFNADLKHYRLSQLSVWQMDGTEPPVPSRPIPAPVPVRIEKPIRVLLKRTESEEARAAAPERAAKNSGPRPLSSLSTTSVS
jgi:hypothetical protein